MNNTNKPVADQMLEDFAITFKLKDAIRAFSDMDPVKALNQAELLVIAMKDRLDRIKGVR